MEADLQSFVAFYLTGKKQADRLYDIETPHLLPASFAGYRDLKRLRYDYPLVLANSEARGQIMEPLSKLIDRILAKIAVGEHQTKIRKQILQLEAQIRALVLDGARGELSALWTLAAERLIEEDPSFAEIASQAYANLEIQGKIYDCTQDLPFALFEHAWAITQKERAQRFNTALERLMLRLSDIIQADYNNSEASRSAERLKHSFGAGAFNCFDFEAMSGLLKKASVRENLPKSRRQRILGLISTLRLQRFFRTKYSEQTNGNSAYAFTFESCHDALKAYRERLPKAIELARAIAMATLEINGEYNEARHNEIFNAFGENGLDISELAMFPDYLVRIKATALSGPEQSTLTEIISADLPIKILVQTDDILEKSLIEHSHLVFTLRSKQLARMTMGMGVFVMQSPAASLYRMRGALQQGLDHNGAALFSVYSGDSEHTQGIPPYLVSAAAAESRLFPAFCLDPSGEDWVSRFTLTENPEPSADWPLHTLPYQDEHCQAQHLPLPFTLAEFVSLDRRYQKHFARVPKSAWSDKDMSPLADVLHADRHQTIENIPYLWMADNNHALHRVLVDEKIVRETRRCKTMWNSLQELGGIHNSHAARALAAAKAQWTEENSASPPTDVPSLPAQSGLTHREEALSHTTEASRNQEDAYIDTPRCASCNECIQINNKMFAYDDNKQAFIADINAGSFAQLVEAAENCQVAIIHPGKPRNPAEAGIETLLQRAEAFA